MIEWWTSLNLAQQIFYFIAILSSFVLVIQIILNFIGFAGGDFDLDGVPDSLETPADLDVPDTDGDIGPFSVRTILAFLVGLGWGGVAASASGASPFLAVIVGVFFGTLFMTIVFFLMRWMMRLSVSGNINIQNAAGQTGTVYIPIPAEGSGNGQVQIIIQGRLRELPAITDGGQSLSTGTHIKVIDINNDILVVRAIETKGKEAA
ncbi:MAG: hypothetical protein JXA21_29300 [Anaerolineae bacterium]|nr:hypothetical protein [Anaerolineae bacterium]